MPQGVIKKYLGERGFGFITPDGGEGDVFFHIKQFHAPSGAVPAIGETVEYVEEIGRDGRLRAVNVRPVTDAAAGLAGPGLR